MKKPNPPIRLLLFAALLLCAYGAFAQETGDPLSQARFLADAGKLAQSETVLRSFIQHNPSSADAHFLLGYVLFREEKPRESLAEFTAGARSRRPAADDFRIIASDYVLLGDYADAVTWFSEVTKDKPEDPSAWYLLGRAQYSEDRFSDAIASFQHALTLRANYIEAENNLGLAWQGLNDLDKAQTAFQTAVEWQHGHPTDAQPYLNLGTVLTQQNEARKALPYLQTAVGLAPKNPKIHEELAHAWETLNQLQQAQHELEQATALAPNVSGLHFKLGRVYTREGLRDRAQQQFDICAKLDSTHSSVNTPNPYTPE